MDTKKKPSEIFKQLQGTDVDKVEIRIYNVDDILTFENWDKEEDFGLNPLLFAAKYSAPEIFEKVLKFSYDIAKIKRQIVLESDFIYITPISPIFSNKFYFEAQKEAEENKKGNSIEKLIEISQNTEKSQKFKAFKDKKNSENTIKSTSNKTELLQNNKPESLNHTNIDSPKSSKDTNPNDPKPKSSYKVQTDGNIIGNNGSPTRFVNKTKCCLIL
ncbi:hypothetical protein TVAG_121810 [Trichomonas vaginalis G3]|uniref:Uncharacterized protein n=1 Tax=Trichomonas vaginalis (strain ATCC PRA-98 / G3) TaxID=412133 RepID=A2E992_TRIV3|nr:hypothetical protein TVAGG3_0421420 [Trichomonas vaginalis G3]EAY10777.1 hypothetical protein TVAG_121810 [Trichomonas vaginalis G3]KAI5536085.1 hypothetical protein TVAGG3_0421420 [Trichomonas vaginalis G3]|eukprot:XP_001323000.1 hypothetical protein [Trichomonas vaginalis G3]